MRHTGDLHYAGVGTFKLVPADTDETVESLEATNFNVGYFIPGDEMHYPLYFYEIPEAGDYTYELSFDGDCEFIFPEDTGEVITFSEKDIEEAAEELQEDGGVDESADVPAGLDINTILLSGALCLLFVILLAVLVFAVIYFARKNKPAEKTE